MKAQFDKYFGTGKEYDEIDTNGNSTGDSASQTKSKSKKTMKINLIVWIF
jgi:DNA polymerase-1